MRKKSFMKFYFHNFEGARLYYNILGLFITDAQMEKTS